MAAINHQWLSRWFEARGISLWGIADLSVLMGESPSPPYPRGVAFSVAMDKEIMASIKAGPNRSYADEYNRVNLIIDQLGAELSRDIRAIGYNAIHLAASKRTDLEKIAGEFPHKTVATLAGLGWIGKCCQLVTRTDGPWVRLGSVFTDAPLPTGKPVTTSFCGSCSECVKACPAGAITGESWKAGVEREALLDPSKCDHFKKRRFQQFNAGHNCNICGAACPYGLKSLKP